MMASVEAEKTELKEEGVIEAATELAQDPESKVNPDTIEQNLVDMTRQAGGAAYQFDPDASPEDKAAAAEAVRSRHTSVFPSSSPIRRDPSLFLCARANKFPSQRVPPGFHHQKKPKGISVITDQVRRPF